MHHSGFGTLCGAEPFSFRVCALEGSTLVGSVTNCVIQYMDWMYPELGSNELQVMCQCFKLMMDVIMALLQNNLTIDNEIIFCVQ